MTKPMVRIHNTETDEVIDREMTAAELKIYETEKKYIADKIVEVETKAAKKQANPLPSGEVCAIDVDAKLCDQPEMSIYLAEQIRVAAKTDKRISYIIHVGKIASPLLNWKWRKYRGINSHHRHLHVSFKANQTGEFFNIPLLGGK